MGGLGFFRLPLLPVNLFSLVIRLTGTFAGLVAGLLAWYLGELLSVRRDSFAFLIVPHRQCQVARECLRIRRRSRHRSHPYSVRSPF